MAVCLHHFWRSYWPFWHEIFQKCSFSNIKLSYFSSSFDAFVWCAKCSSLMSYLWTFFLLKGAKCHNFPYYGSWTQFLFWQLVWYIL
jgi:hypothetical protein